MDEKEKSNDIINTDDNKKKNRVDLFDDKKDNKEDIKKKIIAKYDLVEDKHKASKIFKIFLTLFYLLYFFIYIYFIRPLIMIINLIFSLTVNSELYLERSYVSLFLFIGLIIIIVLPLIIFFFHIRRLLNLANKVGTKIRYLILLLIESTLDLPLTFFYNSNKHSIFLLEQDGPELVLDPWLIFFPSNYIKSPLGLGKNIIISGYFIFITRFIKKDNINNLEFYIVFQEFVFYMNLVNFIGIIGIFINMIIFKRKKYKDHI